MSDQAIETIATSVMWIALFALVAYMSKERR